MTDLYGGFLIVLTCPRKNIYDIALKAAGSGIGLHSLRSVDWSSLLIADLGLSIVNPRYIERVLPRRV